MSLTSDFSENTAVFKGQEKRLDQEAFNALTEERGEDFAKGYLRAVFELTQIIGNVMRTPPVEGFEYFGNETPTTVYGKVWLLHKALYNFVEQNGLDTQTIRKPRNRHGTKVTGW